MKNILFDARHVSNEFSGLGRYSYNLLIGLIECPDLYDSLVIILDEEIAIHNELYKSLINKIDCKNVVTVIYVDKKMFSLSNYITMRSIINKYADYLYFYPHFDLPFGLKVNSKSVFHDLFPLVVSDYITKLRIPKKILFYLLSLHSVLQKRNEIYTISNSTKNDLLRFFPFANPNKIRVALSSDCVEDKSYGCEFGINLKPFLFYIGDRRPHKNLKRMIDTFVIFKNEYSYEGNFVIAGSTNNFNFDIDEYVKKYDYIKLVGNITNEDLNAYYNNMDALFFLSRYEGFGLPVLEAAKFDKKIITSNISSLPEVAPESALLLDPYSDASTLALKINTYLTMDLSIDNSNFCTNYSWLKTAKAIFDN